MEKHLKIKLHYFQIQHTKVLKNVQPVLNITFCTNISGVLIFITGSVEMLVTQPTIGLTHLFQACN